MKIMMLLVLFIFGCSMKHDVETKPIKVEPIVVVHKTEIDPAAVKEFYKEQCEKDLANDTQEKIDGCVVARYDDFLNALAVGSI